MNRTRQRLAVEQAVDRGLVRFERALQRFVDAYSPDVIYPVE